mmetsp:Transcript_72626/g.132749  ORF Transcript_72626/g.132749 Transcript_72626/m.132749 type:complete len:735 (-) Transcript_72626:255-2459(-)
MDPGALKKLFSNHVTLSADQQWLQVRLSGKGLGDYEMAELGRFLDGLLPEAESEEAVWANVELAENVIGNEGLIAVLDVFEKRRVSCKYIKLYKNKIADFAGVRLAEQVRRQESAVEEIHLSHNMFSAKTLVALCMALAKNDAYPMVGRNRLYIPCWVRMEYNYIAKPMEVLEMLRRDGPVSICTADNRDDCGPWRCHCANRTKQNVPKVHLFTIGVQSRSRNEPKDESELREDIRKYGGSLQPVAPSVRKAPSLPTATGPRGMPPPGTGAARTPTASTNGRGAWDQSPPALQRARTEPAVIHDAAEAATPTMYDMTEASAALNQTKEAVVPPPPPLPRAVSAETPPANASLKPSLPQESAKIEPRSSAGGNTSAGTNGSLSGQSPTAAAARKDGTAAAPHAGGGHGSGAIVETVPGRRNSLVLDGSNRRRILPTQMEAEESSGPFVCQLCHFVIYKPVITTCSHLFCESCFRQWVQDQVSKEKRNQKADAPVPLVPCPQNSCSMKLRKQDISPFDKADSTKVGATVALLQRLRNNLRIRCVHHVDHFKFAFGKDAQRIHTETGGALSCQWIGDISAYDDHIRKGCPIEQRLVENGHAAAPSPPSAGANKNSSGGPTGDVKAKAAATNHARMNGGGPAADTGATGPKMVDSSPSDAGEIRIVRYDYVPSDMDKAQIPLRQGHKVKVFEITDSGWAAGVRLCNETQSEVGDAGWFPEGYLFPAGSKKQDHAASTA